MSVCFRKHVKVMNKLILVIRRPMAPQCNGRGSYAAVVIAIGCILLVTDFISHADAFTTCLRSASARGASPEEPMIQHGEMTITQAQKDAIRVKVLSDLLTLKQSPISRAVQSHHKICDTLSDRRVAIALFLST